MRFLFVDVETNDHSSKRVEPRIVTISWTIAQPNGFIEKTENLIVKPDGFKIASSATRIHGVTVVQAQRYGHPIQDVLHRLVADLQSPGDWTIVGHNVDFDRKVIGAELSRNGFGFDIFSLPFICTMQSSTSVCQIPRAKGRGYKYPTLQELYLTLFGHCFSDVHRSKADVDATARCFFELMRRRILPLPKNYNYGMEGLASNVGQSGKGLERKSPAESTLTRKNPTGPNLISPHYQNEEKKNRAHIQTILEEGSENARDIASAAKRPAIEQVVEHQIACRQRVTDESDTQSATPSWRASPPQQQGANEPVKWGWLVVSLMLLGFFIAIFGSSSPPLKVIPIATSTPTKIHRHRQWCQ